MFVSWHQIGETLTSPLTTTVLGGVLASAVGLWRRRRERVDDLLDAAIAACAQFQASRRFGAGIAIPQLTGVENQTLATESRMAGIRLHLQRQNEYRSALANVEAFVPDLREHWDVDSITDDHVANALKRIHKAKSRRRWRWR